MKRITQIRLKESELINLIQRVMNEDRQLLNEECTVGTVCWHAFDTICGTTAKDNRGNCYCDSSSWPGGGAEHPDCKKGPPDNVVRGGTNYKEKYNVRNIRESQLINIINRIVKEQEEPHLLNEERTCREQWGGCMESIGHVARGRRICDDEWCTCIGGGSGCTGMIRPPRPTLDYRTQIRESQLINTIKRVINENNVKTE